MEPLETVMTWLTTYQDGWGAPIYWLVGSPVIMWLLTLPARALWRWWAKREGTAVIIEGEKCYRVVKRVERHAYLQRKVLIVDGPAKPTDKAASDSKPNLIPNYGPYKTWEAAKAVSDTLYGSYVFGRGPSFGATEFWIEPGVEAKARVQIPYGSKPDESGRPVTRAEFEAECERLESLAHDYKTEVFDDLEHRLGRRVSIDYDDAVDRRDTIEGIRDRLAALEARDGGVRAWRNLRTDGTRLWLYSQGTWYFRQSVTDAWCPYGVEGPGVNDLTEDWGDNWRELPHAEALRLDAERRGQGLLAHHKAPVFDPDPNIKSTPVDWMIAGGKWYQFKNGGWVEDDPPSGEERRKA